MQLLFKQRLFSWFDSYDVYNQDETTVFTVQGKLSWGHRLEVHDTNEQVLATLQQRVIAFLPKFDIYIGDHQIGTITKELTFLKQAFTLSWNDWYMEGDFFAWDYQILDGNNHIIATINKQLLHWTDTYVINVEKDSDALQVLLLVFAIDAAKCRYI